MIYTIKYSVYIYLTLFLSLAAYSQKNKCYLYINENDCANCNAAVTYLKEIAIGLEPTVVFGNMSKEEADFGAKEILHLDTQNIPYIISEDIKNLVLKTTKRPTSSLIVVNSKNKVLFECDVKQIFPNIEKINRYAIYTFENSKVVLSKKEIPINFGTTLLHVSDSVMCIKDNLSNIAFYSTHTWQKKTNFRIKDISLLSLYQSYYGDTAYFSNYLKEVEVFKKYNLSYLSVSDKPFVLKDTAYILMDLTIPKKTVIENGEPTTILGNISFICQYDLLSQKSIIYPIYDFNEQDTVSTNIYGACIIEKNNMAYISIYSKKSNNLFLGLFEKSENAFRFKGTTSLTIPEPLLEANKNANNVNHSSHSTLINRIIYFNHGNQLYDMSTKKWHTLPVQNGQATYSPEKGFSTSHMFLNMSIYRGKIYAIEQINQDFYYLIIDKNLKLETKIKLPKLESKSTYVIHNGKIYYINTQNEMVELS